MTVTTRDKSGVNELWVERGESPVQMPQTLTAVMGCESSLGTRRSRLRTIAAVGRRALIMYIIIYYPTFLKNTSLHTITCNLKVTDRPNSLLQRLEQNICKQTKSQRFSLADFQTQHFPFVIK